MPITPAYTWHEAETSVSVDVKIRAVTPTSADILMTDCYAKVNRAPYFFEADLYAEIDTRRSSASVGQDTIKFFLIKKEPGLWGRLTLPGDRKMVLDRRHRSLAAVRQQAHKEREDLPGKLSNIGRLAVGEQMKLEEARRKAIEQKKNEELRTEQESLRSWMASNRRQSIMHADTRDTCDGPCPEIEMVYKAAGCMSRENSNLLRECHQLETRTSDSTESFGKPLDTHPETTSTTWLPAPRRSSSIPVTFTVKSDRPIHLPARESRDKIELKKKGIASAEASNPTEREPIFLQDKADKFFRTGDYLSAINAYTSALEADPSLVLSLVNRAACRLQMGQYEDCGRDALEALQMLQHVMPTTDLATSGGSESLLPDATTDDCTESPNEEISFSSLDLFKCLKAHELGGDSGQWEAGVKRDVLLLRGTAKYHEGKLQQALQDYEQALQFEPTNKDLAQIVTQIQRLLKKCTP